MSHQPNREQQLLPSTGQVCITFAPHRKLPGPAIAKHGNGGVGGDAHDGEGLGGGGEGLGGGGEGGDGGDGGGDGGDGGAAGGDGGPAPQLTPTSATAASPV